MPEYASCRDGFTRYEITTDKPIMGRSVKMCRALGPNDTTSRPGRRTRCFASDGPKRKNCQVLVPHAFETIAAPSYYLPSELQRAKIGYACANPDQSNDAFEGQGDAYNVTFAVDHLVYGPVFNGTNHVVKCVDSEYVRPGASVRSALDIISYAPTSDNAAQIYARWTAEARYTCPNSLPMLERMKQWVNELTQQNLCSDQLFAPVIDIIEVIDTPQKRKIMKKLCSHVFYQGMYQRRWRGPGTPFPIEEDDTLADAQANQEVSSSLVGATDDQAGVPLDYISTVAADDVEGVLLNAVRMHGREALALLDDTSWLGSARAAAAMSSLKCANKVRALEPRGSTPSRFVHSLLPDDRITLRDTTARCINTAGQQMCIRMGSHRLVLTALMLYYALPRPPSNAPWSQQTNLQGEPLQAMQNMSRVI